MIKIILLLTLIVAGWFLYVSKKQNNASKTESHLKYHSQKLKSFEGTVIEYGSNPEGDIDKIVLIAGNNKMWLHFPPHAAKVVTELAPVHAQIEVNADQHHPPGPHQHQGNPDHTFELNYLKNKSTQAEINLAHIPAPAPKEGIEIEINGNTLADFAMSSKMENTFMLSGKYVSLPPHMAHALFPLIRQAKTIFVKGKMRDPTAGFVSASGKPVVRANLIRLDSITYKIR